MKNVMTFSKHILPVLVSALIFGAFLTGVFFRGFDQALFAPGLMMIFAAGAIMLWPGLRQGWDFPASGVTGFLALFWLWLIVAVTWSDVPNISMVFTLLIGAMPFLFFTTMQHRDADRLIGVQLAALLAAIVILALWAAAQFLFLSDLAGSRIRHPMLNPNNLAVILAMGLFPLLMLFPRFAGWRALVAGAAVVVVVFAIMVTHSRGGFLAFLCGTAVFTATCAPAIRKDWRRYAVLGASVALAIGGFMAMVAMRHDDVRVLGGGNTMASANERLLLLHAALQMLVHQPFPGIGLGVFYLVFPSYRNLQDTSDGFFVHIDPLQFAIETGFPVLFLFYGFCTAVLLRMIAALRASRGNPAQRLQLVLPFCSLLALMINTHVDFDLYMLPALLMAAIMLSLWYRASEKILGPSRLVLRLRDPLHRIFLIPAIVLIMIVSPVWLARAGYSVHKTGQASEALGRNDYQAARADIEKALTYGPENYYRAHYIDALWRSRIFQEQFYMLGAQEREDLYRETQAALDRSLRYNPYNVYAISHKAFLHMLAYPRLEQDGLDQARILLEQAVAIDPLNFDARMGLARVLTRQDRPHQGVAVLEDVFRWDAARQYAPAPFRETLAQMKELVGARNEAALLHEEARKFAAQQQLNALAQGAIDRWVMEKTEKLLHR